MNLLKHLQSRIRKYKQQVKYADPMPLLTELFNLKVHFELLPNDPFKDQEVIHIPIKRRGISKVIRVRTKNNKTFRKDEHGNFRLAPNELSRPDTRKAAKSESRKQTKIRSNSSKKAPRTQQRAATAIA